MSGRLLSFLAGAPFYCAVIQVDTKDKGVIIGVPQTDGHGEGLGESSDRSVGAMRQSVD